MSKIAVIVVTYNGQKWIEKCLESIFKSDVDVTIFAVDNASNDNTLQILNEFTTIEIIPLAINLGFGKANNIAIKKAISAGFESFFLLNQDTWIDKQTIGKLQKQLVDYPSFGIVSPLHYANDEGVLDGNFKSYFAKKQLIAANLYEVPFVNAAAWIVSKTCFEKVGLFDPIFDHYGEDRNFCDRLKFHGFKIGILANASIVHDRIIKRNFDKDVLQSKYLILNNLININLTPFTSVVVACKQVIGLPKYFFKFYGLGKVLVMFTKLSIYFFQYLFNNNKISSIRNDAKLGKTGY